METHGKSSWATQEMWTGVSSYGPAYYELLQLAEEHVDDHHDRADYLRLFEAYCRENPSLNWARKSIEGERDCDLDSVNYEEVALDFLEYLPEVDRR